MLWMLLGALVLLVYGTYRGYRKWGAGVLWLVGAAIEFEQLFGYDWGWSDAHLRRNAENALAQGIIFLALGLHFLFVRRRCSRAMESRLP